MPFFKRSDVNYKARLETKLCLAKETPEPVFDLSECNLAEVPSGVYSMCRVFRKDSLLLQDNCLSSLRGGGNLKDLAEIQVLNLESNALTQLPEEISYLKSLKVLNLRNNKLKKLCHSISLLIKLKTLNLSENNFQEFPSAICKLLQLQSLDISGNKITLLPKELCHVRGLNEIILNSDRMVYPPKEICQEGREAIMKYLCEEYGTDYVEPDELADIELEMPAEPTITSDSHFTELQDSYLLYQKQKERRRHDLLEMEESMRRSEVSQAEISAETTQRRLKLLDDVAQEQERMENEIYDVQMRKDVERQQLLAAMTSLENHSLKLISELLELNERNKSSEAILLAMERDRQEAEELFMVKQEELESLRRKDILDAMQNMLKSEEKQRIFQAQRLQQNRQFADESESDEKLYEFLLGREQDQKELVAQLLEEEEYQRAAFQVLQIERDNWHMQLCQQIRLIEKELAKLTGAERKKRDLKVAAEMNTLAERRETLAKLLCQLLEERDQRELALKKRVREMEERRAAEMKDYWLIQYQRLLDRMPQEVTEMQYLLDPEVKEILIDCGAEAYMPILAFKQASPEQLLTDKGLLRLGVADGDTRQAIMSVAKKRFACATGKDVSELEYLQPCEPSAPEPDLSPTAPLLEVWHHEECVICLDRPSQAVFLPCGHVCTCWTCAEPLESCPLCRGHIYTKIPADT